MMTSSDSRRTFLKDIIWGTAGIFLYPLRLNGRALKNVILIGDSIRLGYQPYANLYLLDKANVRGPETSCGHTYNILENAYKWFAKDENSIYHISACHQDIMTVPYMSRKNLVDSNDYVNNIRRIIKYIHSVNANSIIIWGTSTPVIDERVLETRQDVHGNGIYNEDVIKYNELAVKEVTRLGIPVNDLYSFVMQGDPDQIMLSDGVHFTETGFQFLGEQVANAIELFL